MFKKKMRYTKIPCHICGSNNALPYLSCADFSYDRCESCDCLLQRPFPSKERIKSIYDDSYFDYERENEENFFSLMKKGLDDIKFDSLYSSPGRALDVGCATGRLLTHLKHEGWETIGVELCPKSAQYAREIAGIDVFLGEIGDASIAANSIDFAHSSHVIEHVANPVLFLEDIYRTLRPNGYLCLTTPCYRSLQFNLYRSRWRSAIDQHLQLFSGTGLQEICKRANFDVKHRVTWGGLPIEFAQSKVTSTIKQIVDRCAKKFGFGDVMLLLLQKK